MSFPGCAGTALAFPQPGTLQAGSLQRLGQTEAALLWGELTPFSSLFPLGLFIPAPSLGLCCPYSPPQSQLLLHC